MANQAPTQDEVRKARHAGFKNAVAHAPEDKQKKIYDRYAVQDARREKNISGFVQQIRGAK